MVIFLKFSDIFSCIKRGAGENTDILTPITAYAQIITGAAHLTKQKCEGNESFSRNQIKGSDEVLHKAERVTEKEART